MMNTCLETHSISNCSRPGTQSFFRSMLSVAILAACDPNGNISDLFYPDEEPSSTNSSGPIIIEDGQQGNKSTDIESTTKGWSESTWSESRGENLILGMGNQILFVFSCTLLHYSNFLTLF